VDETTYRVAGKLPIEELNSVAGLSISNQNYDTVGGWVLDLFGRVPRKAERVETPDVLVTVEKIERTRVVEVLIALRRPAPSQAAA
jgi:CBS domain containing-hemolysin-like protein